MRTTSALISKRTTRQLLFWWILPLVVIGGWIFPILGFFLPFCMIAGIGIAIFKGRYWCDWLCPRGSSLDLLVSRISVKKRIPALFRSTLFRILVMAIMMGIMAFQIPKVWPNVEGIGRVFVMMLTVSTGIGVLLGVFTHHRNWCTYCPVGTMANWLGRGKYPLSISSACNKCKKCDSVCPIQLKRWEYRPDNVEPVVIPEWDCLKCGLCVDSCPKKALSLKAA